VHAFAARLHERLDDLANTSHLGMSVEEQGETVVDLDRAIARLSGNEPTRRPWFRQAQPPCGTLPELVA